MKQRIASVLSPSSHSSIEVLECRIAPAGIVTANLVGGVLTLTGDGSDNDLTLISVGADAATLNGNNGTLIALNGAAALATVSLPVAVSKVTANLGGGNDAFNLLSMQIGALAFDGGDGNNTLQISGSDVAGALSDQGGTGNDVFTATGQFFHVGGALTLNLGDGSNAASFTASGMELGGATLYTGGSGTDAFSLSAIAGIVTKAITAKLGAGDNTFTLGGQDLQTGSISVTHLDHAGTATTNITASSLAVKGGITVAYGTGTSSTLIGATAQATISGAFKVTSTGGTDNVTLGGSCVLSVGATTFALGNGNNTVALSGAVVILPSLTVTGGTDTDAFNLSSASARMGALTLNLGDGTNFVGLNASEAIVNGLVKVTSGAGDDTFAIGGTSVRLVKGLSYQAGNGVNTLGISAGAVFQSGPIQVNYGSHATGTSIVNIATASVTVSGSTTITAADGNETFSISGNAVTMGPITAKLGEGINALSMNGASLRIGALAVTTGAGTDSLVASGQEISLGGLKAQLGAGGNTVTFTGNSLTVGGVINVITDTGDDIVTFSNAVQKTKGAVFSLGDGLAQVNIIGATIQMAGSLTLTAGDHAAGTSALTLNSTGSLAVGAVTATFGDGNNSTGIISNGPGRVAGVKVTGGSGSGSDSLQLVGPSRFLIGGVTFQGGNGVNSATLASTGGSIGAVKYTGGDDADTLLVQAALAPVGSVTAQMGAGTYGVTFLGAAQTKFAGPVSITTQNTAAQGGTVLFVGATFAAGVTVNGGDGGDNISAADSIFGGSFSLNTAGGDDHVNIETATASIPSVFRGPVTVLLGDGADTLAVGANTPTGHAEFKSTVKFDGGTGMDIAHISAALFANVYLPGQPVALNFETKD